MKAPSGSSFSQLIIAFLVVAPYWGSAQTMNRESVAPSLPPQQAIRMVLNEIAQGIRSGNSRRIAAHIAASAKLDGAPSSQIDGVLERIDSSIRTPQKRNFSPAGFFLDSVSIVANDSVASARISIGDTSIAGNRIIDLHLRRSETFGWEVDSSTNFFHVLSRFVASHGFIPLRADQLGGAAVTEGHSPTAVSSANITYSYHMLLPYPFYYESDGTSRWTETVVDAQSNFGRNLFGTPVGFDYGAVATDGSYITQDVSFTVDWDWRRLVYGSENGPVWMKSYGDWNGDYHYDRPLSVHSIHLSSGNHAGKWAVFIADQQNMAIVELLFDPGTKTVTYLKSLKTNIRHPSDLSVIASSQLSSVQSMWVADPGAGALICLTTNEELLNKFTSYSYGGSTFPLSNVTRVLSLGNGAIAFIDANINAIVTTGAITPGSNTTVPAIRRISFASPSSLNSIGTGSAVDPMFYVTDKGLNVIHRFSSTGDYLASFTYYTSDVASHSEFFNGAKNVPSFNNPVAVSSSVWNNLNLIPLTMFTLNSWTNGDGFHRFLSGADIVNAGLTPSSFGVACSYTLTNQCYYTSTILNGSNSVVKTLTLNGGVSYSGYCNDYAPYTDLGDGLFTWELTTTPYHNSQYHVGNNDYTQQPFVVTRKFITPPRLISPAASATNQSVTPRLTWVAIPGATSYTITVADPGSADYRTYTVGATTYLDITIPLRYWDWYTWTVTANGSGVSSPTTTSSFGTRAVLLGSISEPSCVDPGSSATWAIDVAGNVGPVTYQWFYSYVSGPIGYADGVTYSPSYAGTLSCLITDAAMNYVATKPISIGCSPAPGCPYVSTWNGNRFQIDNNVLPQSEYSGNANKTVTDHYKLMSPPLIDNSSYVLKLSEFESEHTDLDGVKLFAIDHPLISEVNVMPNGEIIESELRFDLRYVDGDSTVSSVADLKSLDHIALRKGKGQSLSLGFATRAIEDSLVAAGRGLGVILGGWLDRGKSVSTTGPPKVNSVGSIGGHLSSVSPSFFTFREQPSMVFIPLSSFDTDLRVNFSYTVALDYAQLALRVPSRYEKRELRVLSAQHSEFGDVLSKIDHFDGDCTSLEPNESILIYFESAPLSKGMTRSFVLSTKGSYRTLEGGSRSQEKPKFYTLEQNYPNPFNPITRIQYQLPEDSRVMLTVFDQLGSVVSTLASKIELAGIRSIEWDATGLASGIYFCRLQATSLMDPAKAYSQVNKMVVMK